MVFVAGLPLQNCGESRKEYNNREHMKTQSELLHAVEKGDLIRVKDVLKEKPNLELKDEKGRTALMIAIYNDNNSIGILLVEAGADVNAQDHMQNSPFLYAGAVGNLQMVKLGIGYGANYDVYNRYGGTALIPAAERGHVAIVKLLAKTPGFPIDHINKLGWTALLEAIILAEQGSRQKEIIEVLINAGANVNIADREGVTPLAHARKLSLPNIVEILVIAGAI